MFGWHIFTAPMVKSVKSGKDNEDLNVVDYNARTPTCFDFNTPDFLILNYVFLHKEKHNTYLCFFQDGNLAA